ncbi:MAG: IS30 family transposase [bacterium]|nr:IS30 family transposase [bacterium]
MGKHYKQLTLLEREQIYALKEQGKSSRDIAKVLERNHRTIAREYERNRYAGQEYIPCKAQELSDKRGIEQRTKAPLKNPQVFLYVRKKLRDGHWSPETISGRLPFDISGESITPETIYQYIYGKGKKYKLHRYLTKSHKKRRIKTGRRVHKEPKHSRIPHAVSIDKRPTKANNRAQIGHFETDLMEGKRSTKTALSITVDRKSRYAIISKIKDKSAINKQKVLQITLKTVRSLKRVGKPIVRSITSDNGSENTNHQEVSQELRVPMYFCHPYHSWEKGSVENMIGRVRRYIPKGTNLYQYSTEQIQWLENKLNNTPRKCLNYQTPNEVMEQEANKYKFRRYMKNKEAQTQSLEVNRRGTST